MKIHLKVVICSVVLTMFLLCFYVYIHIHIWMQFMINASFYETVAGAPSSKSLFVRVFYGEKVEKEGRRELSIRDETSGDKLLKTLNNKKVVQTGIRMKDSSALGANSCNESYNETHVSEKRGNITKQCLLKRKNVIILILVQAEVDLPYLVLY